MFERFTEKARRTIFFARYEASQCGSPVIEIPHLLLGLARENKGISQTFGVGAALFQQTVEALCTRTGDGIPTHVDLPLSPACQQVLCFAAEEAAQMAHRHIGTEHLLLGVLRQSGPEVQALEGLGIRLEGAREAISRSAPEFSSPAGPRHGPSPPSGARRTAFGLLSSVPEDRLGAAIQLLTGIASEFFEVSGSSSAGRFAFSFGQKPQTEPPAAA